jgi:TnpA family transposase
MPVQLVSSSLPVKVISAFTSNPFVKCSHGAAPQGRRFFCGKEKAPSKSGLIVVMSLGWRLHEVFGDADTQQVDIGFILTIDGC